MVRTRAYLSTNLTQSFLTIFIPFFLIISLVYLVKIAALTAQIQLDFIELVKLYIYSLPDIIFYTLPLSFIAALTTMFIRLSADNELIALYSLGLRSSRILRTPALLAVLFSILLLVISLLAMPMSKQLYKSFKEDKRAEAKLNIIPGKLGQKFGNYYIYVRAKDEKKDIFHDLVIYNRTDLSNEQFFAAKYGKLNKRGKQTSLLLKEGYGYTYTKDNLQQAQYKTLEAFDTTQKAPYKFEDTIAYWSRAGDDVKIMHRLLFFLFVSLIPIFALLPVAAFSMINPRYQSNHTFVIIFSTAPLLYLIASSLEKWGNILWLILAMITVLAIGWLLFKKRVARYF